MSRGFENLNTALFNGIGPYEIPEIKPSHVQLPQEWKPFNYALTEKDPSSKGVHFFVDDYQFLRCWNNPERYVPILRRFSVVCAPDFSTYTDMPMAMQIYNHYRKHWLAAFWQAYGIPVIPTISWSTKQSFAWCFDGEPRNSVVAVSSVGTQNSKSRKKLFMEGYEAMIDRLHPQSIIFYGQVPEECTGSHIQVGSFQEKLRMRCNIGEDVI